MSIANFYENHKKAILLILVTVCAFIGICFLIPPLQNMAIVCGGKLIGRALNNPLVWIARMRQVGFLFILVAIAFCTYFLPKKYTDKVKNFIANDLKQSHPISCLSLFLIIFCIFVLPLVVFGQNSVITIHDNLENQIPLSKWIHDNHLFWALDVPSHVMNDTSTLYINREGFTLFNFLMSFLPTYIGYVTVFSLAFFIGFFSMFALLRVVFPQKNKLVITAVSLLYAILPVIPVWHIAMCAMPFAAVIFYKLMTSQKKYWYLLAFVYPFFSEIASSEIFICAVWSIGLIAVSVKQKKLNIPLLLGFMLLCAGIFLANFRLVYMRFFVHEPLNRDFFTVAPASFFSAFAQYLLFGYYHVGTIQFPFIDIVVFVSGTVCFIRAKKGDSVSRQFLYGFEICLCAIVAISFLAALSDAHILDKVMSFIFPLLKGINLSRIYSISRVVWYIAFANALLYILAYSSRLCVIIIFLQVLRAFTVGCPYNDAPNTIKRNIFNKTEKYITYKEFYSEDLFRQIKTEISYNGECVCSVGYHPEVLMYNGFNTMDGYISVYPYKDQILWHNLMLPEFEHNEIDRAYFDSWGGRRYIYNEMISYQPTKTKEHTPIVLDIDMEILRNDFHCKYIFSRAEIANAEERGIVLKGKFETPESLYIIWVYEIS